MIIIIDYPFPDEVKSLRWIAKEGITPGYDITYTNTVGNESCIEVKATSAKIFPSFIITVNEYNAALEKRENFKIYSVAECLSKKPRISIFDNPFIRQSNEFNIEPLSYKVYKNR